MVLSSSFSRSGSGEGLDEKDQALSQSAKSLPLSLLTTYLVSQELRDALALFAYKMVQGHCHDSLRKLRKIEWL